MFMQVQGIPCSARPFAPLALGADALLLAEERAARARAPRPSPSLLDRLPAVRQVGREQGAEVDSIRCSLISSSAVRIQPPLTSSTWPVV